MSCRFFMSAGQSEFSETDNEAGDANLCPYVEELGDYALNQMSKGKSTAKLRGRRLQALCTGLADFRQFREEGEQRNQQKNPGDYEVRGVRHVGLGDSTSRYLSAIHGRQFRGRVLHAGKNESAAE